MPPSPDDIQEEDANDEFSTADLGITQYKPGGAKPARNFEGWHRPRKQFVRRSQWIASLREIYNDRDPADRINYLGLPGTDLLDLRAFYEAICIPQNRELRFLGFHQGVNPGSPEAVSLDIALQEVKLRDLVHESSKVLHDDINKIGSRDSLAFQEARRTAPYDVINLDYTVGFARDAPMGLDSIYNALNRIIAMQQRLDPWLLLVTGLVGRDVFDSLAARKLHELYLEALQCDGFPEACSPYFDAANLHSLDIDSCSDNDYFYSMTIGFCIWVFGLAQAGSEKRVNLRAAFYYQVNPDGPHPDIVSIAIRFRSGVVAAPDPSGLALGDEIHLNQCGASVQFANRFANAVDVDQRVQGDTELRNELIAETVQLLVQSGYDEQDYRQWVAQFTS